MGRGGVEEGGGGECAVGGMVGVEWVLDEEVEVVG